MKKILLSFLAVGAISFASTAQINGYSVGSTVADFTVTDTEGHSHNLYSYTSQGKYVVLDFFFDTCPPCQQTTPIFNELHEKYGCNTGDIICISMNNGSDGDAEVIAFENTYGGNFAHAPGVSADGGAGNVDNAFDPAAYPTYCIVGPDNKLKNGDIWPLADVGTFESALTAAGATLTPMSCATGIDDEDGYQVTQIVATFPNPATKEATIGFTLNEASEVSFELYSLLGKKVKVVSAQKFDAGLHNVEIPVFDLSAGNYFVNLISGDNVMDVTKLTIVK